MDVTDLPVPLSRIEKLWNCLITGETPDFEPLSRNEKYLMAMLDRYDISNLPAPMSRGEKLLYKIAVGETDLSDVPGYLSRYEELLKYLIENGGISGGDFEYVLYTLNQSLYTLYTTAEKPVKRAVIHGDTLVNALQESSSLAVTPMGEDIDAQQASVTGTANGAIKSAILKGNTLVNLLQDMDYVWNNLTKQDNFNYDNEDLIILNNGNIDGRYWNTVPKIPNIKSNTEYTIIFTKGSSPRVEFGTVDENGQPSALKRFTNAQKVKITSPNNGDLRVKICIENPKSDKSPINLGKVMLIEGDYTNIDVPYFEGMQSVKMPVLTTTGKNLFDGEFDLKISSSHAWSKNFIKVLPNTAYIFSHQGIDSGKKVDRTEYYNEKFELIGYQGINNGVATPNDCHYIKFRYHLMDQDLSKVENTQLEQGTVATAYEPFKSNILTCNEEVELRGIGEVKDELDLLTGELTQRVSGLECINQNSKLSQSGTSNNTTLVITTSLKSTSIQVRRKLVASHELIKYAQLIYWYGSLSIVFKLPKSNENFATLENFKQYLTQKPFYYYRELEQNEISIKTVDLTVVNQDGNTVPHLQAFNETTHISTSSTGLIPNVVIPATVSYPSIIKPSTLYTVKLKRSVTSGNLMINVGGTEQAVTSDRFTMTTPSTLTSQDVVFSGKGNVISEVTVVEGDQTDKEYGYFKGIQSVKMPVLHTRNNLFNGKTEMGGYDIDLGVATSYNTRIRCVDFIPISDPSNTVIEIINSQRSDDFWVLQYDNNKNYLGRSFAFSISKGIFEQKLNLNSDCAFIKFYENGVDSSDLEKIEYIVSDKSNILSTPEEVTLRGIGDVQDELDCLTGEVTERIGELVITDNTPSKGVRVTDNGMVQVNILISVFNTGKGTTSKDNIRCDKFTWSEANIFNPQEGLRVNGNTLHWAVSISKLSSTDLIGVNNYLSNNPITVQYQLATESVKTVDLSVVDQDNQPTELGTFENLTHVSLEAENLIPEVEMEVATNLLEDTVFNLTNVFNTLYPTAAKPVVDGTLYGQTLLSVSNYTFLTGKYLDTNKGTFINGGTTHRYIEDYFVIPEGTQVITLKGANNYKKICYYDGNKRFIIGYNLSTQNPDDFATDVPTGASYFRFNTSLTEILGSPIPIVVDEYLHVYADDYLYLTNKPDYMDGAKLISCQAPGVMIVGKNLFDISKEQKNITINVDNGDVDVKTNDRNTSDFIKVIPNTIYKCNVTMTRLAYYDKNKQFISLNTSVSQPITIPTSCNFVKFSYDNALTNIQFEQGSIATSYEPYQSSTLSTPSDLELRKVGDVRDELNVMTGELTERIGEVVLNGSESWVSHGDKTNTKVYRLAYSKLVHVNDRILCDKLPIAAPGDVEKIAASGNAGPEDCYAFYVALSKTKANTLSDFKSYLSENPLTVQYELVTPTTKTVDLSVVDQDGNVTTLKTFDDTTHVLLNSEGLIPKAVLTVRTKIPSGSSTSLLMDDISTKQ